MKTKIIILALALAAFAVQAGGDKKAATTDKNAVACPEKAKAAGDSCCSSKCKKVLLSPKDADAKR